MPRGAEYDNGVPQSDNAIDPGQTKVHGTNPEVRSLPIPIPNPPFPFPPYNQPPQFPIMILTTPQNDHLNRVQRTAELPEAAQSSGGTYSAQGSSGPTKTGSGKGGHEPKTLGEKKGLGAI
ncbi:hypothetical protein BO71DRAFT_403139 [Aspergillus ellipticus CBS 707.79]|uniref:Uncharacterized protein n=1 Tax=Aspergillus ellipticus CBS 707.79 TaxID=1448320 RepID=A0A319CVM5_9EURO|nr:hypothetical protein BO71DRAFT_403139 [Aspergillus ellipticus CBS 707.79]